LSVVYLFCYRHQQKCVEVGVSLKANSTCGVLPSALPCAGAQRDAQAVWLVWRASDPKGVNGKALQMCPWPR